MASPGYNEYKYKVTNEQLPMIRTLLHNFYGSTDHFPEGVVDSIYYDTNDRKMYQQCANGDLTKSKFRIRGYGGTFNQVQMKSKDMYGVSKYKNAIEPVSMVGNHIPSWFELNPAEGKSRKGFDKIQMLASHFGDLRPVIRVRYFRHRYRVNDYRITLDSRIEVMGFSNEIDRTMDHGILPHHVLEVKTPDTRPKLPLFGITKLPQISCSKFFLGLNQLEHGTTMIA
ncbi:MAG: hypothetical protein CMP10_09760 [Zetaproteobacteria bacterium]|nr:hypothetical protein [Pseudobdellovibrionaceae bacterium]